MSLQHPPRLKRASYQLFGPYLPRRLRLAVFASPSSPYRHCRIIFARARLLFIAVIVERRGPAALFCPMVDHPWGGAVALRLRAP
ncbi:hypothetical protein OUZ56_022073 [Daphnia magna]|uniref:Uncharacterized protein n=1 Tax=Daphnia magna TaxID=35525 RepID=A0ABR0AVB9_9CRUS|nr:hypothetical protein OUZ56_022073 [Daphnia magna]